MVLVTEIGDVLVSEIVEYSHQAAESRFVHDNEIDIFGRVLERRLVERHRATADEIRIDVSLEMICDPPEFGLDIVAAESFTVARGVRVYSGTAEATVFNSSRA